MDLAKKSNESVFDYHKRLINGKLDDKTLSDIDYSELSELVYGKSYSSDVARRMMYGSKKTLELIEEERINQIEDVDIIAELDHKTTELKKEKQRFFDQRREYNKAVAKDGRREHLEDRLVEAAMSLPDTVGDMFHDFQPDSFDSLTSPTEAVLVFCDWHYGMTTDNIFNTYNKEICVKRVNEVVEKTIQRILLNNCKKLHVIVLGDLFHGAIHCSARVASEELVCDQIMQSSEILAQAIAQLSRYVTMTYVYTAYGNHGRTVQNKSDSIHRDNMERLVNWWLKERFFDHPCVKIEDESDDEFLLIKAFNRHICAAHGDLDSVRNSSLLFSTLFQKKYGVDVDCVLLADKHHRESYDQLGVTSIICGALCGTDDYANNKRLYSEPSQLLLIVNKDGIDAEYNIKCR